MKFHVLYEIECPRPWGETSIYDCFWEALEQVKVAEEAGFETVWSVEHHFLDQFSVASGTGWRAPSAEAMGRQHKVEETARTMAKVYLGPASRAGRITRPVLTGVALVQLANCGIHPQEVREVSENLEAEGGDGHLGQPGEVVRNMRFAGVATVPTELMVSDTPVGGLSGLVRRGETNTYLAVCDDPNAGRFYQLSIDLGDGRLDGPDIAFQKVIFLKEPTGQPVGPGTVDLEGIGLDADGRVWISSEGVARSHALFIRKYELDGNFVGGLPVDSFKFDPKRDLVRNRGLMEAVDLLYLGWRVEPGNSKPRR